MNYVIISRSTEPETDSTPYRDARMEWMKALREKGTVMLSGPSSDRTISLLVINADDAEAARQIMEADPYRLHDIRQSELIEWEIHHRSD